MKEPNFIIVNDRNTFGDLEAILSEYKTPVFDWGFQTKNHNQIEDIVSLFDLINLDDSKFSKIIDLFSRIQNFDRFKSFFELKPTLDLVLPENPESREKTDWCEEYHPNKSWNECAKIAGW